MRQIKIMGVTVIVPAPSESTYQANSSGVSVPLLPIDVESMDDDVVISSPSAFEAAKNNARRVRRRTEVVDLETEDNLNAGNWRQYPASMICDSCAERENPTASVPLPPPPPPPPPPPEPTFNCPVCMGPISEEVTTKCGHIFCKKCILEAVAAQHKCPTCRRRVWRKEIMRVYLPSTN